MKSPSIKAITPRFRTVMPKTRAKNPKSAVTINGGSACENIVTRIKAIIPPTRGRKSKSKFTQFFLNMGRILPLSVHGRNEAIALPGNGLDKMRVGRVVIQGAAQFRHARVDRARARGIFPAPDGLQQAFTRHRLIRMGH